VLQNRFEILITMMMGLKQKVWKLWEML